jgi:hypothetical protein
VRKNSIVIYPENHNDAVKRQRWPEEVASKSRFSQISEPLLLEKEGSIQVNLNKLRGSDMFPLINRLADLHRDRKILKLRIQVTPKVSIESGSGTFKDLKSEAFFMQAVLPIDAGVRLFSKIDSASIDFQPAGDGIAAIEDDGMILKVGKDSSKQVSVVILQYMKGTVIGSRLEELLRKEADLVLRTATEIRGIKRVSTKKIREI